MRNVILAFVALGIMSGYSLSAAEQIPVKTAVQTVDAAAKTVEIVFFVSGKEVGREKRLFTPSGTELSYSGKIPDGFYRASELEPGFYSMIPMKNGKENGNYKTFYQTGKLSSEAKYKNGLPNGAWKTYYPEGGLSAVMNMKNSKQDGKTEDYYPGGTVKSAHMFKDGIMVGDTLEYYPSGKLKSRIKHDKRGQKTSVEMFNEDGTKIN